LKIGHFPDKLRVSGAWQPSISTHCFKIDYKMRLPNFLIVGVPKSATTSLHNYLGEHPQIYMPDKKDYNFFTRKYRAENSAGPGDKTIILDEASAQEYRNHFINVKDEVAVGESSTSYFYCPQCNKDIKAALGSDLKIIVALRNPIDRAFSNYMHLVREGRETLSFYEALQQEETRREAKWSDFWRYKDHSLYAEKMQACLDEYGAHNVKVLLFEDFAANQLGVLQDVFRFLEVDPEFVPPNINIIYNKGGRYSSTFLKDLLMGQSKLRKGMKQVLPRPALRSLKKFRSYLLERNTKQTERMDDKSREFLTDYFKHDVETLQNRFGLDVSKWKLT
jgi:hypothetical protein